MPHLLSPTQYIFSQKTLGSNMRAPSLLRAQSNLGTPLRVVADIEGLGETEETKYRHRFSCQRTLRRTLVNRAFQLNWRLCSNFESSSPIAANSLVVCSRLCPSPSTWWSCRTFRPNCGYRRGFPRVARPGRARRRQPPPRTRRSVLECWPLLRHHWQRNTDACVNERQHR